MYLYVYLYLYIGEMKQWCVSSAEVTVTGLVQNVHREKAVGDIRKQCAVFAIRILILGLAAHFDIYTKYNTNRFLSPKRKTATAL